MNPSPAEDAPAMSASPGAEGLFPGASEMAARMRAFSWADTSAGSPDTWPHNLRTAVSICLTSRFPMQILWGPALTLFYNDASIPLLRSGKHPDALGRSGHDAFGDRWHYLGPVIEEVLAEGQPNGLRDVLVSIDRVAPSEEAYVSFSFSPLFGESGRAEGVFCVCNETTEKIVGARRLEALREFAQAGEPEGVREPKGGGAKNLAANPTDLPFARIIEILGRARNRMELALGHAEGLVTTRTEERDTLLRQLVEAEEAERRSLAREVHDQLGQHLTALALGLAETRRVLGDREAADARLARLERLAQRMTGDARRLALELRLPELDEVGFTSALTTHVDHWTDRVGVPADVAVNDPEVDRAVSGQTASALFRITQEALANTAKHARATHASIVVERTNREIRLVIEDDGCGFDNEVVNARSGDDRRLGFAGMRERAALLGGELHVESSVGGGTAVYVRVPTAIR